MFNVVRHNLAPCHPLHLHFDQCRSVASTSDRPIAEPLDTRHLPTMLDSVVAPPTLNLQFHLILGIYPAGTRQ
jgi:hypothetical protein